MNKERLLASMYRFGESFTVLLPNGENVRTRGFIQPLRYKNRMYVGGKQIPDGYRDGGNFTMTCPPVADFTQRGVRIRRKNGLEYTVKRADDVVFEDSVLYVWAVLTPFVKKKEDFYSGRSERLCRRTDTEN